MGHAYSITAVNLVSIYNFRTRHFGGFLSGLKQCGQCTQKIAKSAHQQHKAGH